MDPISDMLIALKNGNASKKEAVTVSYSKLKNAIADVLVKAGYIKSVEKKTKKGHPVLEMLLAYEGKNPKISEVERISKPSRRLYFGVKDIRRVKGGRGLLVLSTPKGVMAGDEARKQLVGGEALFQVW